MDLKKLFNKGVKAAKENLTEEGIVKIIKEVAEKLNIKLSEDKIKSVANTIKSKVKDIDLEKVKSLAETEIKKLVKNEK